MTNKLNLADMLSSIFAIILLVIGVLNIFLVHPVPGLIYLLFAFIYTPFVKKSFGFSIPGVIKIIMGIAIMMFTLGVSDLGDMIDKL
jgi:hypothetical protein